MGYAYTNTVVIYLPEGEQLSEIRRLAHINNIDLCETEDSTDLIAVPSFLAIIDPNCISESEWEMLCEVYREMKLLLMQPSPYTQRFPTENLLVPENTIDAQYLKFLMIHLRSRIARRRAVYEKTERQIVRLMYMLCQLDNGSQIRPREIANEFQVTIRTIQRDIQVLLMAGYPINGPATNGTYQYAKPAFQSYRQYYS